ncbi:protein translocase subunit SecF [candidate division KSB1 bacterium]
MELIKRDIDIDFLSKTRTAFMLSGALILIGLISLLVRGGPNYGIDFKGGTLVQVVFDQEVAIGDIRTALSSLDLGNSEIKEFGSPRDILIRTEMLEEQARISENIMSVLRDSYSNNTIQLERVETVGPKIGGELIRAAVFSIGLALFFLIIYISWRFEFKFALGAIAALIHDVIITVGIFSLLNKEITLAIVAALLTIVGYSLNDTIVVSDRIRENLKVLRKQDFYTIINRSLNQTLSRTIITSVTTLIVVIILFIWGGEVVKDFAFALIVGVSIGTYSSVFVATPIVVKYRDWREARAKAR